MLDLEKGKKAQWGTGPLGRARFGNRRRHGTLYLWSCLPKYSNLHAHGNRLGKPSLSLTVKSASLKPTLCLIYLPELGKDLKHWLATLIRTVKIHESFNQLFLILQWLYKVNLIILFCKILYFHFWFQTFDCFANIHFLVNFISFCIKIKIEKEMIHLLVASKLC